MEQVSKGSGEGLWVPASPWFEPDRILDCGQCFRWRGSPEGVWSGVVGNRTVTLAPAEGGWRLSAPEEAWAFWTDYFDLQTDYSALEGLYTGLDPRLDKALALGRGIRILRQPFWETAVSFVLSANNNIPRIQGMIDRLSRHCGDPLGEDRWGFPGPEQVARCTEADLRSLGFGYRAPYVKKLSDLFASGAWTEDDFREDTTEAVRKRLLKLPGVGPKVADCILLFALHRLDAFPVDVWIRNTLERLDQGKPEGARVMDCLGEACRSGSVGYVQQVLFYSARYQGLDFLQER